MGRESELPLPANVYCVLVLPLTKFSQQQVDGLRRQRDRYLEELKELADIRRKQPELLNLQSQISGVETRLKYSKKDRDVTVSLAFIVPPPVLASRPLLCVCVCVFCSQRRSLWRTNERWSS